MRRVYVAHKYEGKKENKQRVEKIIKQLVKENPETLYMSPIHTTGFLYNDVPYEKGMEYCYELMSLCDELLLTEDWEDSRGCRLEKKFAEEKGIPIKTK